MCAALAVCAAATLLTLAWGAASASAAVYFVGSTTDDAAPTCLPGVPTCTLRSAMTATAASAEADTIAFALPDDSTISPATALPPQPPSGGALTIDGARGPGVCAAGDPRVNLDGSAAPEDTNGLVLRGAGSTLCGLAVHSWTGTAIELEGTGAAVVGSYIGTDTSGVASGLGNTNGIAVEAPNATIGRPDQGNVVVSTFETAISVNETSGGGTTIAANRIGTGVDGVVLSNYYGVKLAGDGTTVGGVEPGTANTITNTRVSGVRVLESGRQNPILGNVMYANGGGSVALEPMILYSTTGREDPLDADTGGNDLQNKPNFQSSLTAANSLYTRVQPSLVGEPNETYRLEYFYNSADRCRFDASDPNIGLRFFEGPPAERFLGAIEIATDENGSMKLPSGVFPWDYFAKLPPAPPGSWLSGTATDSEGNTSGVGGCPEIGRLSEPDLEATVIPVNGRGKALVELTCQDATFPCDADVAINVPGKGLEGERLAVTVPNDRRAHVRTVKLRKRTARRVRKRGKLGGRISVTAPGAARVKGTKVKLVPKGQKKRGS